MVTINLTNHFYVKDHYELVYTVDADPTEFRTQYFVEEGSANAGDLQQVLLDAYVAKQTGVDFNYVVPVPPPATPPTAEEQAIIDKQAEVDAALAARNEANVKTIKAEAIAARIALLEPYIDLTVDATLLDAIKTDLKEYTTPAVQEYKTANDDYDTKRVELDVLLNP